MAHALRALGYGGTGRYQARSLMREAGVWVRYPRRYRVTTNSNHRQGVFPNRLERDFAPEAPDPVYAGDITQQSRVFDRQLLASTTLGADRTAPASPELSPRCRCLKFPQPSVDRRARPH
jgi:transposase InsO family protein